jgi:hypothetical protein
MTWLVHHRQSEHAASDAECAYREGRHAEAKALYRVAAEAESLALATCDTLKTRTLGVTVVSAVALWGKAGDRAQAQHIAQHWLRTGLLPPFAIAQLHAILRSMPPA